jgi:Cu(I)/Ag(I) efflux system membrane fusion protein
MAEATTQDHETAPATVPARRPGRSLVMGLVGFVIGAVAGGLAVGGRQHDSAAPAQPAVKVAPKATLYQCPMHPAITADHPGDCPICGMKLVEVKGGENPPPATGSVAGLATVTIDPSRQQLIGLRTAKVETGVVGGSWRTIARVEVAPSRVRKINVKVEGFVEHMYVDFVGQNVRKGQPLFSIYSPALLAAQNELLLALHTRDTLTKGGGEKGDGDDLVQAARRRLALWDVPAAEIERLERTREPSKNLTVVSPIAGVVTAKNVVQGARVSPGEAPYEITDLGEIWVMADAYERDLGRIKRGMSATLTLAVFPGRTFTGTVAFIDPILDAQTRTAKVHLHFMNGTRDLRPGMFGEVELTGLRRQGLSIPADAVIRAGTEDVVFLAKGGGKFEPRVVNLGERNGEDVEVTAGLTLGQEVVTRANFLVDSESQLRASLSAIGGQ